MNEYWMLLRRRCLAVSNISWIVEFVLICISGFLDSQNCNYLWLLETGCKGVSTAIKAIETK